MLWAALLLLGWAAGGAGCPVRAVLTGIPLRPRLRLAPAECTAEAISAAAAARLGGGWPGWQLEPAMAQDGLSPLPAAPDHGELVAVHALEPRSHRQGWLEIVEAVSRETDTDQATAVLERLAAADPGLAQGWQLEYNRGVLHRMAGRYLQAGQAMERAIERGCGCLESVVEAAESFKLGGQPEPANKWYETLFRTVRFTRVSDLKVRLPMRSCQDELSVLRAVTSGFVERLLEKDELITVLRVRHDLSQLEYLSRSAAGLLPGVQMLRTLQSQVDSVAPPLQLPSDGPRRDSSNVSDPSIRLPAGWRQQLAPWHGRAVFVRPTPAIARAIEPRTDVEAIEHQYATERVTHVDGLLTDEALQALQLFVTESTIWFETMKIGYLGSYWHDGFSNPLLIQVANELSRTFPNIFEGRPLMQMWGYKYDSNASAGIQVHADEASVNVNLWLTPDDAVLDKSSGGLRIFLKEAPGDWTFEDYNKDHKKIFSFLDADGGSEEAVIPYRTNRAVIFHSNFFHTTDQFRFKCCKYNDRRINVTMLFGKRTGFKRTDRASSTS